MFGLFLWCWVVKKKGEGGQYLMLIQHLFMFWENGMILPQLLSPTGVDSKKEEKGYERATA